jgi:hypothetical protein
MAQVENEARAGETVAWRQNDGAYAEGTLRKKWEGSYVVVTQTPTGFARQIIDRKSCCVPTPWRTDLAVNSRVHVFLKGLWFPAKVCHVQNDFVSLVPAFSRTVYNFRKSSQRLQVVPNGVYNAALWDSKIAFTGSCSTMLWSVWVGPGGVLYEKVDSIYGVAILQRLLSRGMVCVKETDMVEPAFMFVENPHFLEPPQKLIEIKLKLDEMEEWCPHFDPTICLELLSAKSHALEGSPEKKLMAQYFNTNRFCRRWVPSRHNRQLETYNTAAQYVQNLINGVTPDMSEQAFFYACTCAQYVTLFKNAIELRKKNEQRTYLECTLKMSDQSAVFSVSTSGASVVDLRFHFLAVTNWLVAAKVVQLPTLRRRSLSRFSQFRGTNVRALKFLIQTRETQDIANAFSASGKVHGKRHQQYYDLAHGFVKCHRPVFGGALSCNPHDIDYRRAFASVCVEGERTLVVAHVNLQYCWYRAFEEEAVPVHKGPNGWDSGVLITTFHQLKWPAVQNAPFDRVIFENADQFGSHTSHVRYCNAIVARKRWCVSDYKRTSFGALHGSFRILHVQPFCHASVPWNNVIDRFITLNGALSFHSLLRKVFLEVQPAVDVESPVLIRQVINTGNLTALVKANKYCAAANKRTFQYIQGSMLSSSLLPLSGFATDEKVAPLSVILSERQLTSQRVNQLKDEMTMPCAVCLEPMDNLRLTPCNHVFCNTCIEACKSLTANTCPICRSQWNALDVFVTPLSAEAYADYEKQNAVYNGWWLPKQLINLHKIHQEGPKSQVIKRLAGAGQKTVVIVAHKEHANWLSQYLGCRCLHSVSSKNIRYAFVNILLLTIFSLGSPRCATLGGCSKFPRRRSSACLHPRTVSMGS